MLRPIERALMAQAGGPPPRRRHEATVSRIALLAGIAAAILFTTAAVRLVAGLSTAEKPSPLGSYEIPSFDALLRCDAHFSHEILRIKNGKPAHNSTADLDLLLRNYRRLHRLMRQVGRRDGIEPKTQTDRLRAHVKGLNSTAGVAGAAARDVSCRTMAELPLARSRRSQLIIGQ